ncbi:hypothetical protein B0H34DRAFT_280953 [Crassisporium funariophilum]|nr:hypothetical protein B0H34DRAFT_280953 [Crassisporium funariophilum]
MRMRLFCLKVARPARLNTHSIQLMSVYSSTSTVIGSSPEQQCRTAKWVNQTSNHTLVDAFTPSGTHKSSRYREGRQHHVHAISSQRTAPYEGYLPFKQSVGYSQYTPASPLRHYNSAQTSPTYPYGNVPPPPSPHYRTHRDHHRSDSRYHNEGSSSARPTYSRRRSKSWDPSVSRSTSSSNRTYETVHASARHTTVLKPTSQPVVVPLDEGRGGYVVVPPRGRELKVFDMRNYSIPKTAPRQSFFKRFTAGFMSNSDSSSKLQRRRRDSY